MPNLHLGIVGMTCEHCVRAVRNRLAATKGVEVIDVTIGTADLRYDPSAVSTSEIEDAVSDEGYTVDTISELAR
jgi:copper chaperone